MKIEISEQWTATERLRVIGLIASYQVTYTQMYGAVPKELAFRLADKIRILATADTTTLNANAGELLARLNVEVVEVKDK